MKFQPFSLCCECGLMPARIKQVGLSEDHQLVIHWWCLRCRKAIYVVKDLEQCLSEHAEGEQDSWSEVVARTTAGGGEDDRFLASMGIRFLSEGES